jgi:2-polyprenyl-6-methoxyphenol hydroxylase-like FAD-dependent oxidoreductase
VDAWEILYDHAIKSGVEVIFGKVTTGVNEQLPAVLFEDGSSMEGDLIVGADGMILPRIRTLGKLTGSRHTLADPACTFPSS